MSKLSAAKTVKEDSANNSRQSPTSEADLHKQTAAQYIYNSLQTTNMVQHATLRKMNSIDKSSNRSSDFLSVDMLPEDMELPPDLHGGLFSLQSDSKRSINSSDFVKNAFLSEPSLSSRDLQIRSRDAKSPVFDLTAKLERVTTGDDIMGENIRLSSSEWIKDFEEGDDMPVGPMPQSMFYHASYVPDVTASSNDGVHMRPDASYELSPIASSHELEMQAPPLLPPISPPSSTEITSTRKKKRRQRIIDESNICEPNDNDVLFGRGGYTNNRPGNIHFRQEALRLRQWYEQSTKEEKYEISNLLLESVKSRGGRFLEKGSDGKWHEVIGNGARRKASQALRERINRRENRNVLNPRLASN